MVVIAWSFLLLILSSDIKVINPSEGRWLFKEDFTPAILGLKFFLSSPWSFPLGNNFLYGGSLSSSIIYSGSIPWLAFSQKILAIKNTYQFYGLYLFLNMIMQGFSGLFLYSSLKMIDSRKLNSKNKFDVYDQIIISLLFVFAPIFVANISHNFNLQAHWLIIYSMAYFIVAISNLERVGFAINMLLLLIALALLTDAYIAFMCISIWLALIFYILKIKAITFTNALKKISLGALAIISIMYFSGYFGYKTSLADCCFGRYGINLLGFIDPRIEESNTTWSKIIPDIGGQSGWEAGFCFIGLPTILIIIVEFKNILIILKKLRPLYFFLIPLSLMAITNKISFATISLDISIPKYILNLLDVFRGSGRFIWPLYYLIIASSLVCILKNSKINNFKGRIFLILIFSFSLLDMSQGLEATRNRFVFKNYPYSSQIYNFCKIKNCEAINFINPEQAKKGYDVLANTSEKLGIETNAIYLARFNKKEAVTLYQDYKNNICSDRFKNSLFFFRYNEIDALAKCSKISWHSFSDFPDYGAIFIEPNNQYEK